MRTRDLLTRNSSFLMRCAKSCGTLGGGGRSSPAEAGGQHFVRADGDRREQQPEHGERAEAEPGPGGGEEVSVRAAALELHGSVAETQLVREQMSGLGADHGRPEHPQAEALAHATMIGVTILSNS